MREKIEALLDGETEQVSFRIPLKLLNALKVCRALDGAMVGVITTLGWALVRLCFGAKAVAVWRWERRGFYKGYWYVLYYFSLVALGLSLAQGLWVASAVFAGFYVAMGWQEADVRSGRLFRAAYVKEASR